jgi:hypothetical protein
MSWRRRCESAVARHRGVVADGFNVFEKREHGVSLHVVDAEVGDGATRPVAEENEEQS